MSWLLLALFLHRSPLYVNAVANDAFARGGDVALNLAVVERESWFNPRAVGKQGDYGLYQLHPRYHPTFRSSIKKHIRYGGAFLDSRVRTRGGDLYLALLDYNAGGSSKARGYALSVLALYYRLWPLVQRVELNAFAFFYPFLTQAFSETRVIQKESPMSTLRRRLHYLREYAALALSTPLFPLRDFFAYVRVLYNAFWMWDYTHVAQDHGASARHWGEGDMMKGDPST